MQTPSYRKNALIIGIAVGIVFVICLIFIFLFPSLQKNTELTALVYQDGKLIHTINLGLVTDDYELTIFGDNGQYNLIEVRRGSIGITDASCPDKLCVHMGFQETTLLPITCLPNNVVVRIVESSYTLNGSDTLDGVTH